MVKNAAFNRAASFCYAITSQGYGRSFIQYSTVYCTHRTKRKVNFKFKSFVKFGLMVA